MGRGITRGRYLHIKSVQWSVGGRIRSLCGLWNPPCVESLESGKAVRLPKETCPACRNAHGRGKP